MSNLTDNLYAIDIETGGLNIGTPIIEVAYGPVFSDELSVLWNADILPEDCEQEALDINHCFDPARAHHPAEMLVGEDDLVEIVANGLSGKVLIGQNTHFDAGHLEALLNLYDLKRTWSYRLVNLSSLVAGYAAAKLQLKYAQLREEPTPLEMPLKGWSQQDAAKLMGVEPVTGDLAHTAAGDVENVKAIARKVFGC